MKENSHHIGDLLIALFWVYALSLGLAIILAGIMRQKVSRLAPPSEKNPIVNMLETINHSRIWREHRRLFPKSRLRAAMGFFLGLAAACFFGIIALMLAPALTP